MRMIEQEIIQAIRDKKDFSTSVVQDMHRKKTGRRDVLKWSDMGNFMYSLWGHTIAKGDPVMKILFVCDCGYPTATTKSRLNAIFAGFDIPMSCSIRNEKTVFYLDGQEIKVDTHNQNMSVLCGEWRVSIMGFIL